MGYWKLAFSIRGLARCQFKLSPSKTSLIVQIIIGAGTDLSTGLQKYPYYYRAETKNISKQTME